MFRATMENLLVRDVPYSILPRNMKDLPWGADLNLNLWLTFTFIWWLCAPPRPSPSGFTHTDSYEAESPLTDRRRWLSLLPPPAHSLCDYCAQVLHQSTAPCWSVIQRENHFFSLPLLYLLLNEHIAAFWQARRNFLLIPDGENQPEWGLKPYTCQERVLASVQERIQARARVRDEREAY